MTRDDPLEGESFSYRQTRDGLVLISHSGRVVKTLRGAEARKFIAKAAVADTRTAQLLMAKVTGPFKFGNERAASEQRRRKGA